MNVTYPFEKLPVNEEWTFKNVRSTEQWTHGYHRYPAKFLPNIVKKIIEDYTNDEDVIADLFAGCGTTLVESKIHGRKSVGVDINPVAKLIANAKIKCIEPSKLDKSFEELKKCIEKCNTKNLRSKAVHERIDYWFGESEKLKINFLYESILKLNVDRGIKNFFLVGLSNVLKNCSKWLQTSTKPQIDPNKIPSDPFTAFKSQIKKMQRKNAEFFDELKRLGFANVACEILLEDARNTSIETESIDAIITSPPYVTSYEYADLHQLTGYWYDYIENLREFRKNFIGTFYSYNENLFSEATLAQRIIRQIEEKHTRTAKEVSNYFNDISLVAKEMKRILKPEGRVFLVVGNTTYKEVKINTAEVFSEILTMTGFKIENVIKRTIPYKLIPTIRDKKTGKFTTMSNKNSQRVYPEEYIVIAKRT
ncbi:MAG: hypothetical protein CML04_02075 [Pseudozobellia sp.]|nr:hypothetical protein [Pseudozobellia sp.]MBG48970.1 hypothetical protein [Pseudozobellia sp.]|tara:strand:+ start:351708 stop:352973 length:1266 start_codon:yes stop_codon:yes gene_type:complete